MLYLITLGEIPVHTTEDECRRALVPLEMILHGDFLSPTINGEPYLNKPPLYNWLVIASYKIFGVDDAFAVRFPMWLSLMLHGWMIWWVVRKYVNEETAGLSALGFMTVWRILTLESIRGLLEQTMALVMYSSFMAIFILGEKKKYRGLFVISYALTGIAFLIKGLPAFAHQAIALLVYFLFIRQFRRLLSLDHVIGICTLIGVLASFYVPFFLAQDLPLEAVWERLFDESAKRFDYTSVEHFLQVAISFPRSTVIQFLPWTLLIVFFFQRNFLHTIKENRLIAYTALLFIANIPVYWFATLNNPHYLYFLLPLLLTVSLYFVARTDPEDKRNIAARWVITGMTVLLMLVCAGLPLLDLVSMIPGYIFKSVVLGLGFGLVFYAVYRKPEIKWYALVSCLLLLRLSFNWFVIPQRIEDQQENYAHAAHIHQITAGAPLSILASFPAGYYDPITYPLELLRHEILRVDTMTSIGNYYLVDDAILKNDAFESLYSFPFVYADRNLRFEGNMHLVVKTE